MFTTAACRLVSSTTLFLCAAALSSAQSIAPARSGTVDYFEGDVTVDGAKLVTQVARFTELKEQSVLHTGLGRAEILLTPGVILRVGENSSVKMLDTRLVSTRVEFLSGTAMVEALDSGSTVKDPPVTIVYKDFEAQPVHNGVFELNSQSEQVRVFKGEARVVGNGTSVNVKDGNRIDLSTTMATTKFDAKDGDELYVWSRDRSAYLSAGNMSSARTLASSGYGSRMGYIPGTGYGAMGFGSGYAYTGWNPAMWNGFSGGWYYNAYLNMYSYLPFAGTMYSPFGFGFYNPMTIADAYMPGYYWTGAGGARTSATTGVPLSVLPKAPSTRGSAPLLPRLGATATLRPTLSSPARGTEPGARTASLASRSGFSNPAQNNNAAQQNGFSNVRAAAPMSAAPMSAPSAAVAPAMSAPAAAPRAVAGRR